MSNLNRHLKTHANGNGRPLSGAAEGSAILRLSKKKVNPSNKKGRGEYSGLANKENVAPDCLPTMVPYGGTVFGESSRSANQQNISQVHEFEDSQTSQILDENACDHCTSVHHRNESRYRPGNCKTH